MQIAHAFWVEYAHFKLKLKHCSFEHTSLLIQSNEICVNHFQDPSGRYVVLYSYTAQDENDLSVERGQCVTVLNSDDPVNMLVSFFH